MTIRRHLSTRWLATALLGLAGLAAMSAARATDVGVSIGFSQPGVYGRVDIGRYPQPVLIAPRPVVIGRMPAKPIGQKGEAWTSTAFKAPANWKSSNWTS